jgi:hypothetical protein
MASMGRRGSRRSAGREFVYRSNYLHEADLVANELEERGIAFYRAEEGPPGVRWAMPLSPSWEPGTCYLVIVPAGHAKRAKELVKRLPVSQDAYPGVWRPEMTDADKQFWRFWAWISLAGLAVAIISALISALRR